MKKDIKAILSDKLKPDELSLIYKAYDIVGDIVVMRVPETLEKHSKTIAEAILLTHKHVKSIWRQTSPISGDFRLRKLEWVTGEKRTETTYKEYGRTFQVDLEQCYFSPRLSYERMRIAKQVQPSEVIVNMFAGVGCYSIIIAKHSKAEKIYSIDINPIAVQYMQNNIRLNKVGELVIPIEGDARKVIEERFRNIADRILMPLPERAYEYIDCAISALKRDGGWIHYYDFEHARKDENPVEKVKNKVSQKLQQLTVSFNFSFGRIVRTTGPNWYQIVLDIKVKEK